jgi:hypothetical protein
MKFSNILHELLLLEYSNKIINQLVTKFKEENPDLASNIIVAYINRFKDIQNSPNVTEKDITKYSWKDLETVVDANQPKRIKAGKINDAEPEKDSNLIYNENGLRIYQANTKKACIKYGNGYSFCIAARGDDNMFNDYRYRQNGTPYFIFDDTKTSEKDENDDFIDPAHVLVLFNYVKEIYRDQGEYVNEYYTITDANNKGDEEFESDPWNYPYDKIVKKYPKLKGLEHLFKHLPKDEREEKNYKIENKYSERLYDIERHFDDDDAIVFYSINHADKYVDDILSGKKSIYLFNAYVDDTEYGGYETRFFAGNKKEYERKYNNAIKDAKNTGDIINVDVKKIDLSDNNNHDNAKYIRLAKQIVDNYRKELSKVNLNITD